MTNVLHHNQRRGLFVTWRLLLAVFELCYLTNTGLYTHPVIRFVTFCAHFLFVPSLLPTLTATYNLLPYPPPLPPLP